jgi:hypothetical protein
MNKILLGVIMLVSSVDVANATAANDYSYTLSEKGAGTFSSKDVLDYNLDFGTITQNSGSYTANFSLKNTGSAAFKGSFGALTGVLKSTGIDFTKLASTKSDSWAVTFSSATLGKVDEILTIKLWGLNCTPSIKLHLVGNVVSSVSKANGGGSPLAGDVVSPVPEAEEWAMMMLGLGMMGFVAKRKKALAV